MEINKSDALLALGTALADIDALTEYTANVFAPLAGDDGDDSFLEKWEPVLRTSLADGTAEALNRHLVKEEFQMRFVSPETLRIELFHSVGGTIPIIMAENTTDFETMIRNIVYKGKEVPNIGEIGASFVFGKFNRFIILSEKSYSNVSARRMGLDEAVWRDKSLTIRKHHECAHYYMKRFMGSSRNNLHDELIADFCGIYAAFGEYRAEWFLKFLGLSEDSDGVHGRIRVYIKGLSPSAARVIERLAVLSAKSVEAWTKTDAFARMNEAERIRFLCEKELLAYVV